MYLVLTSVRFVTMRKVPLLFILKQITEVKLIFNPLSANPTKWPNTLKQFVAKLSMNCLSVFDHFLGLALNGLNIPYWEIREYLAGKYLFEVTCKNIIHPTVAFHIEISQISGFYMKCNARLKLVNFLNIEPNEF